MEELLVIIIQCLVDRNGQSLVNDACKSWVDGCIGVEVGITVGGSKRVTYMVAA